jgi:hypothetical protein
MGAAQPLPEESVRQQHWALRLLKALAKAAGMLALLSAALVAVAPYWLSWRPGLRATLALVNRFIPGQVAVQQARISPAAREKLVLDSGAVVQCVRHRPACQYQILACLSSSSRNCTICPPHLGCIASRKAPCMGCYVHQQSAAFNDCRLVPCSACRPAWAGGGQ